MSALADAGRTIRPRADDPHGPLAPLLLVLTFVTGLVDAVSYLKLGHVFVANMTGNVVFLGFALAGAKGLSSVSSLLALVSFLTGALLGGRLGARHAHDRARLLWTASATQTLALTIAFLLALTIQAPGRGVEDLMIVTLALAMGIQNAAARRLAVPDLTTTVLTLTLTGVAADAALAGGGGSKLGRRMLAVATMALGALIGGLLALHVAIAATLGLALSLVALVGLAVHAPSRGSEHWRSA